MTGYFRDGLCRTEIGDTGTHTVCAVMTADFTRWIQSEKAVKSTKLILEATHEKTLEYTSLNLLVKYAFKETSFDE